MEILTPYEEFALNKCVETSKIRDTAESVTGWGGYRPGAGRKPAEVKRKPHCFRLTKEEHAKVKAFIAKMKEESRMYTVKGRTTGKKITVNCDFDSFLLQFYGSDEKPDQDRDGCYIVDDETIESTIAEYPDVLK